MKGYPNAFALVFVGLSACVILGACSKGPVAASPEDAWKLFAQAMKDKDGETAWALLTSEAQQEFANGMSSSVASMSDEKFKEQFDMDKTSVSKLTGKELFVALVKASKRDFLPQAQQVSIESSGDAGAYVVAKIENGECRAKTVKDDGGWKLSSSLMCRGRAEKGTSGRGQKEGGRPEK